MHVFTTLPNPRSRINDPVREQEQEEQEQEQE